ncbi:MAG: 30S ribosome-binding factor RbfA [Alkalilacustris sp.]
MGRRTDQGQGRGAGRSQRQLRVGELIRRRLSEVLARGEVHDDALSAASITVGEVQVSPDLRVATAYVMPLGGAGVEAALAALRRNKGELRHLVAGALATKYTPELRFRADETFDRLDATRRMFSDPKVQQDLAAGAEDEGGDVRD